MRALTWRKEGVRSFIVRRDGITCTMKDLTSCVVTPCVGACVGVQEKRGGKRANASQVASS